MLAMSDIYYSNGPTFKSFSVQQLTRVTSTIKKSMETFSQNDQYKKRIKEYTIHCNSLT